MNPVAITNALALLNAAISATENYAQYRAIVSQAVAEGRDVSDTELASAATELDAAINEAEGAKAP